MSPPDSLQVALDKALDTIEELEDQLKKQPQLVAIRGAQRGDIVFLIPRRDLSAHEAIHLSQSTREFSRESGIRIAVLPAGFSIGGKPTEDDVCVYAPEDEGHGSGVPLYYDTGCEKRWYRPAGLELYPFCAHCGKPIQEAPFSAEYKPKRKQ